MPLPPRDGALHSVALGRGAVAYSQAERERVERAWRALVAADTALVRSAQVHRRLEEVAAVLAAGGAELARSPARAGAAADVRPVSAREQEVIAALIGGESRRVVARRLGVSVATLNKHVQNVNAKLSTASFVQAARRLGVSAGPRA
nr:LuxR C-terminal-related transcriptional regulator [Kineococcus vitellinus]